MTKYRVWLDPNDAWPEGSYWYAADPIVVVLNPDEDIPANGIFETEDLDKAIAEMERAFDAFPSSNYSVVEYDES